MTQSNRTRRDFIRTCASLAGAGSAIPYFFAGGRTEAGQPNSEKLVVAAIGVGGRGHEIGTQVASLAVLAACADVDLGNANHFAARIGGNCKVYQDYRRVLDRKDVQAVVIATPDHWHVKTSIDAMKAGKDVYCEKPLTLTIEESKLVCKAVKETGRVFQVGTQQRTGYDGCFLEAVAIARSGRLGAKLTAKASVGGGMPGGPFKTAVPPKDLDWDFWLGQAPEVPFCPNRFGGSFRHWLDYSGGNVTDWGVHHTDIALWALGGEHTGATEVEGKGNFPLGRELTRDYLLGKKGLNDLPNSYNAALSFEFTLTLPNGNVMDVTSVGNERVFITGETAHLAVNRGGIYGKFVAELKKSAADKRWLDEEVAKLYRGKPIHGHMANFFDCVKDRSLPVSDVFTHCNSVNACHMGNIAMLVGRKVKWDLEKQEFVADDEANRLTWRKQRRQYAIQA